MCETLLPREEESSEMGQRVPESCLTGKERSFPEMPFNGRNLIFVGSSEKAHQNGEIYSAEFKAHGIWMPVSTSLVSELPLKIPEIRIR
jgi:hypothetical protein